MRLIPTASVAYPRMLGTVPKRLPMLPDLLQPRESLRRRDQPVSACSASAWTAAI